MFNFFLLLLHIVLIATLSLFMLRLGREAAATWLGFLGVTVNLFVHKQISIVGLHVTASEAVAVGYLLTLNLIQEYYGKKFARQAVKLTFLILFSFALFSMIHLFYIGGPNSEIFSPLPRLFLASLTSFFTVQLFDISLFNYLRNAFSGRFVTMRTTITLVLSQALDTVLFTFLGLWGIVDHPFHVILFSMVVKCLIIFFNAPFVALSKRFVHV